MNCNHTNFHAMECEACTDPQPQEQTKDSSTTSPDETPAGCGPLEPVAWIHVWKRNVKVVSKQTNDIHPKYYGSDWEHTPLIAADTIAAIQEAHAKQYEILCKRTDEVVALTKERDDALLIHQLDTGTESAVAELQEQISALQAEVESAQEELRLCQQDAIKLQAELAEYKMRMQSIYHP